MLYIWTMRTVHLVECPRDAIQGWSHPISTEEKIAYYRALLDVGFDSIDIGSFVSHKAVPQMADTAKVLRSLESEGFLERSTRILTIVANVRGALDAASTPGVTDIGFPLSISPTFQKRNTNASIELAWNQLRDIAEIAHKNSINLVAYLSMGFGNPYGDPWSLNMLEDWAGKLHETVEPAVISLSDTIGKATSQDVRSVFEKLIPLFPAISMGAHLHAAPWDVASKITAAYEGGCRRFDGAMRGIGGCPMAQDDLVGNIPTEKLVEFFKENESWEPIDIRAWNQSLSLATSLFSH